MSSVDVMHTPAVAQLYRAILSAGPAGAEQFYAALRTLDIDPVPNPVRNTPNLYATNPVILPGTLVEAFTADANSFCEALRERVPNGAALLTRAPALVQQEWASLEVADQLVRDMQQTHPLTSIDAFLVETPTGIDRAYLEWQTLGTYTTLGLRVLACAAQAWPVLREQASFTATQGLAVADLERLLRHIYLQGTEDDPRQAVIIDYTPHQQPTRQEFYAMQALTGGIERGMGLLDPRELLEIDGRPHYRRDGLLIPIRRVFSRLVYSDMRTLHETTDYAERGAMRHLFQNAEHVTWINHPLHFFYGSKADFPEFYAAGLSSALPPCWRITPDFISHEAPNLASGERLTGYVQKPTDLQSGKAVTLDPLVAELQPGWVLQQRITPAAYHPTLWGDHTPEVRVMCVPNEAGELIAALIYNRVKAPHIFLSNAGHIAQLNIPGTGEGFGVVVFE